MSDSLEIPEHIRKAAATVDIFFKVNGIKEWALMGIQSRGTDDTGKVLLTKEQHGELLKWEAGCRVNSDALKDALRHSDNQRLEIINLKAQLAECQAARRG